jgi:hypothetical protein
VAINMTEVPAHIGFDDAETDTVTGRFGLTVIVIVLDVAGLPVTQARLEVIIHDTVLSLTREALLYVGLLVPTFAPLSFH